MLVRVTNSFIFRFNMFAPMSSFSSCIVFLFLVEQAVVYGGLTSNLQGLDADSNSSSQRSGLSDYERNEKVNFRELFTDRDGKGRSNEVDKEQQNRFNIPDSRAKSKEANTKVIAVRNYFESGDEQPGKLKHRTTTIWNFINALLKNFALGGSKDGEKNYSEPTEAKPTEPTTLMETTLSTIPVETTEGGEPSVGNLKMNEILVSGEFQISGQVTQSCGNKVSEEIEKEDDITVTGKIKLSGKLQISNEVATPNEITTPSEITTTDEVTEVASSGSTISPTEALEIPSEKHDSDDMTGVIKVIIGSMGLEMGDVSRSRNIGEAREWIKKSERFAEPKGKNMSFTGSRSGNSEIKVN